MRSTLVNIVKTCNKDLTITTWFTKNGSLLASVKLNTQSEYDADG